MSAGDLRLLIGDSANRAENRFVIIKELSRLCAGASADEVPDDVRDLIIRSLEFRNDFGELAPALDALTRQIGLFPYLDSQSSHLGIGDLIALEAHRPFGDDMAGIVFHSVQARAYRHLMAGKNVILSAPTSFGKSLIIDAMISSGRFRNCVVVVPTLALIDETRRRLTRFRGTYKLITHPSQATADRNLFVVTQERFLEYQDLPEIDFFVIDEFYKLDPRSDQERSQLLNQAFYRLWKGGGQFYLLGPNIRNIPEHLPPNFDAAFIKTDYSTVALDVSRVDVGDERSVLIDLCRSLDDPTLIYCKSPKRAREAAKWLISADLSPASRNQSAVAWLSENYSPEWTVPNALAHGVGIHHGRLPRFLAQYMVRAFNEGKLKYLICTSTLIEGVNTAAKNVIILDNRVALQKYDYFTFNNIRGRSGRMFRHFTGRVFLFHAPPQEELPFVDLPAFSQSEDAADSLLIQLAPEDLSERAAERLEPITSQHVLSLDVIRANSGLEPNDQIALAEELSSAPSRYSRALAWNRHPTWDQLEAVCELMWKFFLHNRGRGAVFSARQLTFRIHRLRQEGIEGVIRGELQNNEDADEAIENALEFLRQWPGHHFPRMLIALDRIQHEVFQRFGVATGSYWWFAREVESLFLPQPLGVVDEYGIPLQLAARLQESLVLGNGLDPLLESIKELPIDVTDDLDAFELQLLRDVQSTL